MNGIIDCQSVKTHCGAPVTNIGKDNKAEGPRILA